VTSQSRLERGTGRDVDRGTPARGTRQVSAILPSGRTIWLEIDRPLAPASALPPVMQMAERSFDRRRADGDVLARAIARLSASIADGAERIERERMAHARTLARRIAGGDNAVDGRLATAREALETRLDKQLQIDRENVRRLFRRDRWDKILLATSLPLFAAYGQPGQLLGGNNLTLTLLLIIWLAGDHVVETLFGTSRAKSPYAVPDADAWSYLAPIGNALAAWWLLGGRQHERFVTGITTVRLGSTRLHDEGGTQFLRYHTQVKLVGRVGEDHFEDFETFSDVPAVATIGGVRLTSEAAGLDPRVDRLRARVDEGVLKLSFRIVFGSPPSLVPSNLGDVDVAWMVDTEPPAASAGS
jgi:hypothetical protein